MISPKLSGVLTATVTPVDANRAIDLPAVGRLTDYYVQNGIRGVLCPSSTGESFALSPEDRLILVREFAKRSNGRLSVLANCSDHSLKGAIGWAERMAGEGADFAVCMPPQFLEYSQEELREFFYRIADASPAPLVVYNHMTRLNNKVSADLLIQLTKHGNIAGIKDTHNDPGRMLKLYAEGAQRDFAILAGGDGVAAYAALLSMEMLNALSAVKPRLFINLYAAGRAGDMLKAAKYQLEVDKLMSLFTALRGGLSSSTLFCQAIKAALSDMGLCSTNVAQLGYDVLPEDIVRVRAIVASVRDQIDD